MCNTVTFDWNLAIAVITLFAAIVVPAVTNYMNNKHTREMWILEHKMQRRIEAVENYLQAAARAIEGDHSAYEDFRRASAKMYLYAPEKSWHLILRIDNIVFEVHRAVSISTKEVIANREELLLLSLELSRALHYEEPERNGQYAKNINGVNKVPFARHGIGRKDKTENSAK